MSPNSQTELVRWLMIENPWSQVFYIGDPAATTSLLYQLIGNVEIQTISFSWAWAQMALASLDAI